MHSVFVSTFLQKRIDFGYHSCLNVILLVSSYSGTLVWSFQSYV